jgi:Carboxypeptidase regulatory-like domain/TonB dependent receptor
MRRLMLSAYLLSTVVTVFAQSDRGTITGTISDQTGAVVASAPVQARHQETGAVYQAASSNTGNYTLSQLPTGTYEVTVDAPGFKKFVRENLVLPVAQTLRVDVTLEVGTNTESVTVSAEASLLKTESGELSHNVSVDNLDNLPILATGSSAGSAGIRNPYAVLQVLPGSDWNADTNIRLNGLPSNTESMRVEGMDATNSLIYTQSMTQPSVDAIQEFSVTTSNFAAEYGMVGGGFFNVTMKSGTNQFHGSAYEYFVNSDLNAGTPFTNNGNGGLLNPPEHRNDYGFTVGGPVWIPRVFNGKNKLFFFFSFEQFRQTITTDNVPTTVPIEQYREGNFSQALTGLVVGTDPLGRPILQNEIYDPNSQTVYNGQVIRNPFPNNTIPESEMDSVALKVQNLIPLPNQPGLVNNYLNTYVNPTLTMIPSLKMDYQISSTSKLSGYWSRTSTSTPNNGPFPVPITTAVPSSIVANTVRLNFDQTLTPTMLLHFGVGLVYLDDDEPVQSYNPATGIGLTGTNTDLFPSIQDLCVSNGTACTGQGGMAGMGPGIAARIINTKPTAATSLTWVRGNHTYKFGGEMIVEGYQGNNQTYANGWLDFSATESGLPSTNGQALNGGTPGFPYASFLLGAVDSGFDAVPSTSRLGSHALSGFAQDSWKVTRKITFDYGLRYDFESYLKEGYGMIPYFSASTPNPAAGDLPGAVAFNGYGPGHCNCNLAHNYPFAFGPRLGLAYQFAPKTVFRAGAGVSYYTTSDDALNAYSTGSEYTYAAPAFGTPAFTMAQGMPYKISWPNFNPGQVPLPGTISSPAQQIDPNAGKPARIFSWSVGIQREIVPDLMVEAAYVGNRGAYWNSAYLSCLNCLTPQALAAHGLSLNNPADLTLLGLPLDSPAAIAAGFGPPYSGFPLSSSVSQSLRPFPQFGCICNMHWAPDGDSWYNSLQAKATKRVSHGIEFQSSFTWSKSFAEGTEGDVSTLSPVTPATNDVFNHAQNRYLSGLDQPFLFVFAGTYTTPRTAGSGLLGNKFVGWLASNWQVSAVLRYSSGLPIMSPTATNGLAQLLFRQTGAVGTTGGTYMDRVPGVPLYTVDINCHCYNPNTTFVLNPAAWVNPGPGQWGTAAAYYDNYRYQRRPAENMSLGRIFRIKERANLQIRAEFTNIFNRTEPNNPYVSNALLPQTTNSAGQTTSGFGYINTGTVFSPPRQGQLVARFQF